MVYLTIGIALVAVFVAVAAALAAMRRKGEQEGTGMAAGTAEQHEKRAARTEPAVHERQPRGQRKYGEPAHILIVDDQPAIRMLLAEVFHTAGLQVYEASNGRAAIEMFRAQSIDFVLIDLKMPDMDGIEALKVIRSIDADVEAVMISAYGDAEKIEAARRLGVHKFFTKPFDIEKLRDYVLNQLEQQDRKRTIFDQE
jgi:CheY-like chemotaxis protein